MIENVLAVVFGIATVVVWAFWKDRQNKKAHAELMRRIDVMRDQAMRDIG